MNVTAVLTPAPEGGYTAYNPETGSVSEGETLESALENLKEAVGLYLDEFPLKVVGSAFVTTISLPEHA
jgi:predicted RNase H-like HicB family nuclease